MTQSDLQSRAVQNLLRRAEDFRNHLLTSADSTGVSYQHSSSIAYGSWDLIKLFTDTPRIGTEVRTMEDIVRYMASHCEHTFYCQMELWSSLNSVLDALAKRFSASEIFGSAEKLLACTIKTLEKCDKVLSYNHVDFELARFLLLHAARMSLETAETLTETDAQLGPKLEQARAALAKSIVTLEKNSDAAAVTARENVNAALAVLSPTAA